MYNFFIQKNETMINYFCEHDQEIIVSFLNNLFVLEMNIKNILFEYFYRFESNINRNLEILIFRYFFHHELTSFNSESIEKNKEKVKEIIYGKHFELKDKRDIFKEIQTCFHIYDFKSNEQLKKYISE